MRDSDEIKQRFIRIYILAVVLFVAGYLKIFKDDLKNKALIYFGIITVLWGITSHFRYYHPSVTKINDTWMKFQVPNDIKCFFGEKNCEKGDFNTWTILHFFIYLVAGMLFPDRYLFFFAISILCELYEQYVALYSSKLLLDPLVNMFGYFVGNMIIKSKPNILPKSLRFTQ